MIESLEHRQYLAIFAPDPRFGNDGKLIVQSDGINTIVEVARERVVIVDDFYDESRGAFILMSAYHGDGTVDRSFNPPEIPGIEFTPAGVTQNGEPILNVSGNQLIRFTNRGKRDKSFFATVNATIRNIKPQSDGTIIALIDSHPRNAPGRTTTSLARFKSSGELDTSFGAAGFAVIASRKSTQAAVWYDADPSGRVYASADNQSVIRLSKTGLPDYSFGRRGVVKSTGTNPRFYLDRTGQLFIMDVPPAPGDPNALRFRKHTESGAVDRSFAHGGEINFLNTLSKNTYNAPGVVSMRDGTIVVQLGAKMFVLDQSGGTLDGHIVFSSNSTITRAMSDGSFIARKFDVIEHLIRSETVTLLPGSKQLRILGTTGSDRVELHAENGNVVATDNGKAFTYPISGVASISANLSSGPNLFTSTLNIPTTIFGGNGKDTITTGNANDQISTSGGDDVINSNGGDDLIYDYSERNTINGGLGTDTLYGQSGGFDIRDIEVFRM